MPNWDMRDEPAEDVESDASNEDHHDDPTQEEENVASTSSQSQGKKTRMPTKFAKVAEDEKKKILKFFNEIIGLRKCIAKKQAVSYIRAHNSDLEWEQVKSTVNNKVQYLKKSDKEQSKNQPKL